MTLEDAMRAAGLTPPARLVPGKWMRFPGVNKGRANRAGWCRVISPSLAIFGDWSLGLSEVWRDGSHVDDERSREALAEARRREREFQAQQGRRHAQAAQRASEMLRQAVPAPHPYLAKKGFPTAKGLVLGDKLLVPVRDVADYTRVLSVQEIGADGEKKFLAGGRTRFGVFRLGAFNAERVVLCEGFATGLSLDAALARLGRPHAVVVCFSARNLELVAERFPRAVVVGDNDVSGVGQASAKATGLRYWIPPVQGEDFNDMYQRVGLFAATAALREGLFTWT